MAKNKGRHLLVIRLSALGDTALCIPVLLAFKRQYPDVRLTVLTRFDTLMEPLGITVVRPDLKGRHSGVLGLWRLASELRKLAPDAVADLHDVLRSKLIRSFLWMRGIPFAHIDKGRSQKKALTRPKGKVFKPVTHTIARYAEVFRELGYPLDVKASDVLDPQELAADILQELGEKEGDWIGIAPFAAHAGKQYPLSLMEEVIDALANRPHTKVLLFGAPGEEARQLEALAASRENCRAMAGKFTFGEEISLISNLDLMVAMDSGNGHIAAAYGVPVLTVWGVTHPYAGFAPFNQPDDHALLSDREKFPEIPTSVFGNRVPPGYEKAMETIPPASVTERIGQLLDQARDRGASERM